MQALVTGLAWFLWGKRSCAALKTKLGFRIEYCFDSYCESSGRLGNFFDPQL